MENAKSLHGKIKEFSEITLRQCAPEEIVILEEYELSDSDASLSNNPLSFGLEAAIALVTPAVVYFFTKFFDELAKSGASILVDKVRGAIEFKNIKKEAAIDVIKKTLREQNIPEENIEKCSEAIFDVIKDKQNEIF